MEICDKDRPEQRQQESPTRLEGMEIGGKKV